MNAKELIEKYNAGERDFRGAYLTGADLERAHLSGADLRGAALGRADLSNAKDFPVREAAKRQIVPVSGFVYGWKKLSGCVICKIRVPANVPRTGGVIGRKCRAQSVVVISGTGTSWHDGETKYAPGKTVTAPNWDPNPLVECSGGIHFFITREEAEDY